MTSLGYQFDVLIPTSRISELLCDVISSIISLKTPPNRIVVVLPPGVSKSNKLPVSLSTELVVINSDKPFQVNQRNYGISYIVSDYCLCIDDDVLVTQQDFDVVTNIYKTVSHISHSPCVSPMLYQPLSYPSIQKFSDISMPRSYRPNSLMHRIYSFLIPFSIKTKPCFSFDNTGMAYSLLDNFEYSADYYHVDWSRGGFRFLKTSDLQPSSYPFSHKALYEDIWSCLESSSTIDYFVATHAVHSELMHISPSQNKFVFQTRLLMAFRYLLMALKFRLYTPLLIPRLLLFALR